MSFFLKTTLELLSILRFEWVTVESGNTDANLLCVRSVYKTALWNNNIKNSWINAIILDYSESNPAQLTCDQLFQSIRIWRFWILQECDVYIKKKKKMVSNVHKYYIIRIIVMSLRKYPAPDILVVGVFGWCGALTEVFHCLFLLILFIWVRVKFSPQKPACV